MDLVIKIGVVAAEVVFAAFCLWIMFRLFRKKLPGDDVPGANIRRWPDWH